MLNTQNNYCFYAFAGIGGLFYDPILTKDGKTPVSPGVNVSASFTGVIPAGLGIKFNLQPRIAVCFELGGRYTFSNYLDGYASPYGQRLIKNDTYYFSSASIVYKLRTGRNGLPIIFPNGRPSWLKIW